MSAFMTLGRALQKHNEETETKRSTSRALITIQHVVLWASLVSLIVGIALLVKTGHSVDPTGILVVVSVSRRTSQGSLSNRCSLRRQSYTSCHTTSFPSASCAASRPDCQKG